MKVDYQKHYANINKKSLARIRKIVKEPKAAFTTGDFQRASPEKFARMVEQVGREMP